MNCYHGCVSDKFQFRHRWVKRVRLGKSDTMRAIRARIQFRNKVKREPSALEVQAYMRDQFTDQVTHREVSVAFQSGKEVRQTFGFLHDQKLKRVSRNWRRMV